MLRIKKFFAKAAVTALAAACIFAAKSSTEVFAKGIDKTSNLVLVLGTTRYFPAVSLNTEDLSSQVYEVCDTYGKVSALIADGDPYLACDYTVKEPGMWITKGKKKQLSTNYTSQIMAGLAAAKPKTPETDTLTAISKGASILHSVAEDSDRKMVIYGSGLDTTSVLDFAEQDLIHTPVESIVKQLKSMNAIPDLTGISSVTWIGIGQTCGEQSKLTADYEYRLKERWKAILLEGGISEDALKFDDSPIMESETDGSKEELPECSTVPVVEEGVKSSSTTKKEDTGKEIAEVTKWDGDSSLQFQGDKAEFTDGEAALAELSPVADYLKANPDEKIYIFGMTATMTGGGPNIELAEARANACRAVLLEQGAGEGQITVVGLGQLDNPLRVYDVDESGKQIQELAQQNRAVVIVKAESELVDTLLGCVEGAV